MTKNSPSRIRNLSIAGISALTGFVALGVVIIALLAGLWLDGRLNGDGTAVICTLAASVPVSLFLMIRIALSLVRRIQPPQQGQASQVVMAEKEE